MIDIFAVYSLPNSTQKKRVVLLTTLLMHPKECKNTNSLKQYSSLRRYLQIIISKKCYVKVTHDVKYDKLNTGTIVSLTILQVHGIKYYNIVLSHPYQFYELDHGHWSHKVE